MLVSLSHKTSWTLYTDLHRTYHHVSVPENVITVIVFRRNPEVELFIAPVNAGLLVWNGSRRRPIQRRYFWLQGSKGRCHGNQILVKTSKKSHKNGINSLVCDIPMQFGFEIGFNSEFIYDTPVHKGQRAVTMATNCGTKIAINAFLREITRTWLLITGGFRGQPIQKKILTALV